MGYAHQAMGDYDIAIRHLEQSLLIFEELKLSHYAERARETITSCRGRQGAPSLLALTPSEAAR
jgi:hypothetical protein